MATLATHQKVDPQKKNPTGGETIASNNLVTTRSQRYPISKCYSSS